MHKFQPMKRSVIITADGSTSIQLEEWNEQYHSKHGAIQEAKHVFLRHGLQMFSDTSIQILEIGFGTGLNCLLTALHSKRHNLIIRYSGVEAYPVAEEELKKMNYVQLLENDYNNSHKIFAEIHKAPWEKPIQVTQDFELIKRKLYFSEIDDRNNTDLIYFDAFGPRVQPELWTTLMFKKMFSALKKDGILVTYSAKGSVRRNLQEVGFTVERLPGPPGKREMLRAIKY